jgi:RNA polymerase sigma factor (sigma-70 family)
MPFPATHLSLVRRAGSGDALARARAEEALASVYWTPIYAHIRLAHRQQPADAEDLTQGFFVDALRRDLFARYDPSRARFRTYVRTCVDSYVVNAIQTAHRQKRGGDRCFVSIERVEIEARLTSDLAHAERDTESIFQDEWVRSVFAAAVGRLRDRCFATGREVHFALFERYDLAESKDERPTYAELANEQNIPATQVTNWLAAVRRDFRAIVLETLRDLTGSDEEFRDEARALLGVELP